MEWQVYLTIIWFIFIHALIISGRFDQTKVVLLGAFIAIVFGFIHQESVFSSIDFNALSLLTGMMIIVGLFQKTGVFGYVAIKAAKVSRARPIYLLVLIFLLVGSFSAFLDNVTTVLLFTPIILQISKLLKVSPFPYLITEIIASNIGGTATLVGDPPNIMIGSAFNLSFNQFIEYISPAVIIVTPFILLYLIIIFKKYLKTDAQVSDISILNEKEALQDIPLLKKSLIILFFTFLGFIFHDQLHIESGIVAMGGAIFLLLITRIRTEKAFHDVEWDSIFFFIGLFIMVGSLKTAGFIEYSSNMIISSSGGDVYTICVYMIWGAGLIGGIIGSVPMTALMIPVLQLLSTNLNVNMEPIYWSLSLGICFGGNLSLTGSIANLVVASSAKDVNVGFSFFRYMKKGLPVTIISLVIAHLYIYWVFFR